MIKQLKLEGRSGCKLEINSNQEGARVFKSSGISEYNDRLRNQYKKQKQFSKIVNPESPFRTPGVYRYFSPNASGLECFEMDYIHGEKYSEFFERATIGELKQLIRDFIDFIDEEIRMADMVVPDIDLIGKKILALKAILKDRGLLRDNIKTRIERIETQIPDQLLPIGFCHGDLTLSNLIITRDHYYLVDFLDSFIESPIIDIVKLRQDTRFHWSLHIESNLELHQQTKITQVFRYFDRAVTGHFQEFDFYQTWYPFFEILNLIRIVPYLSKKAEIELINKFLVSL